MELNNITTSKYIFFIIIFFIILIGYFITIKYLDPINKIKENIALYFFFNSKPMLPDEIIFRNMIDLPGRDPLWLTSSMVAPIGSEKINDEKEKISRMEALNIMYNDGINDKININSRPMGLFVIP